VRAQAEREDAGEPPRGGAASGRGRAGGAAAPAVAVPDAALDPVFAATLEATEEAVVIALWFAGEVTGREGRTVRALPRDDVLELLASQGRLER
jgi:L-aminopeptidase/D-esterase-like protein